ncbi:MAG: Fe(3+) ABC transporter substrate-binding protein, partial [Burkholderiaceae bacterium]|nr:Fe(3+) ABC transporter substrate-binding protein [Burkholderiaceae bacterium]
MTHPLLFAAVVALGGAGIVPMLSAGLGSQAQAASKTLNLYTARHYSSDDALYVQFTAKTGIKINLASAGDEPLLERIRSEGAASPADVILLADATRLWRAEQEGLF